MSYKLAGVIWNDDGTMATKTLSPLEVSKQLKDFIFELELGNVDKLFVRGSFDIIEKALKALEIIKNKNINVGMFKQCCDTPYEEYKESWEYWHKGNFKNLTDELLTQEEYDILKEVLL